MIKGIFPAKWSRPIFLALLFFIFNGCGSSDIIDWQNGRISRLAGTGEPGYGGDGEPADRARLNGPAGLAIDKMDNIYVAGLFNCAIRKIDSRTNIITTVAGSGSKGYEGDGDLARFAKLSNPEGIFVDGEGNLFIADSGNNRIRRVDTNTGIISTIAGNGAIGFAGDGGKAEAAVLNHPAGVVVDSRGNIYFNDYRNDRIRRVDNQGIISTHAGTGIPGYSGDGGPANKAEINDVYGLAIDVEGNLFLMDSLNFAVRRVDARSGTISTMLGKGRPGPVMELVSLKNGYLSGVPHPKGTIGAEVPHALEVDTRGDIFIAETASHLIRIAHKNKRHLFSLAGSGKPGWSGDYGPARLADLEVHGLRMDSQNRLIFVDFVHHVVRTIEFPRK